jgi:serine/threonine-protein kinase RsbW/stage II sporulation protein AB (anti-sigma F factor)
MSSIPSTSASVRALRGWDLPDLQVTVVAHARNVAVVRRAVEALIEDMPLGPERRADVILAVGEACANAVMHAYADVDPGTLELRARAIGRTLEIVVADRGHGMAPRPDSPGLGLGLPLIATLARSLELREGRDGGTEVWMTFELPVPAGGDDPQFARTA